MISKQLIMEKSTFSASSVFNLIHIVNDDGKHKLKKSTVTT